MKKSNLSYDELIKLCNEYFDHYESKEGDEYVKALTEVFDIVNRNDKPFLVRDIKKQPTIQDFNFKGLEEFKFICNLKARPMTLSKEGIREQNEKIEATGFASKEAKDIFQHSLGVAYMITCEIEGKEHIIKFGQTRTAFKHRLGSYNCGVVNNWRTASTTNLKMLQSILATREKFNLYLRDCSEEAVTYTWAGIKSVPFSSALPLAIEDILMKAFVQKYGRPPLANVQASATEIE